jgi:hypothetical protein
MEDAIYRMVVVSTVLVAGRHLKSETELGNHLKNLPFNKIINILCELKKLINGQWGIQIPNIKTFQASSYEFLQV